MPLRRKVNTTGFSCIVPSKQCHGTTRAGTRCKLRTVRDNRLCHHHLRIQKRVVIKDSGVPQAGKGLFATRNFATNQIIGKFYGQRLSQAALDGRYDTPANEYTAPYGYQIGNRIYDALCRRNYLSYSNDAQGSVFQNNTENVNGTLRATQPIAAGDEIFWSYGADYWQGPIASISERYV